MTKSASKFQLALVCVPKRKECDHMRSAFCSDKGHVIEIVDVLHQNQLSRVSLNSRSICFCSIQTLCPAQNSGISLTDRSVLMAYNA